MSTPDPPAEAEPLDTAVAYLSWASVALGLGVLGCSILASYLLGLGLTKNFAIGGFRTTVQLSLLGYILIPVFHNPSPWWSLLIVSVMATIAAREAWQRSKFVYSGMFLATLATILLPSFVVLMFALAFIIPVTPWWTPQYIIPLMGMVLNNALNSISVGLSVWLSEVGERRHVIDDRLAKGATWWEAVRPLVIQAMRTGLMPTLNNMNVLGLVSIPGMMTGQILGGNPPQQAARYQMIIFFLICTASTLGLLGAILVSCWVLFDSQHRLLAARLSKRKVEKVDIVVAFLRSGVSLFKCVRSWFGRPCSRPVQEGTSYELVGTIAQGDEV